MNLRSFVQHGWLQTKNGGYTADLEWRDLHADVQRAIPRLVLRCRLAPRSSPRLADDRDDLLIRSEFQIVITVWRVLLILSRGESVVGGASNMHA